MIYRTNPTAFQGSRDFNAGDSCTGMPEGTGQDFHCLLRGPRGCIGRCFQLQGSIEWGLGRL